MYLSLNTHQGYTRTIEFRDFKDKFEQIDRDLTDSICEKILQEIHLIERVLSLYDNHSRIVGEALAQEMEAYCLERNIDLNGKEYYAGKNPEDRD